MKISKLFRLIIFTIIIIFFCSYFMEKTGYYEYNLQTKKILTEQEMLKFEQDVKEGKDVSLEDYLSNTNIDYSNTLTNTTSNISIKLNKYLKTILVNGFDIFDGLFK